MIEARGVGLLKATPVAPVSIHAAVDLDVEEDQRLPKPHKITILGQSLPLFRRVKSPHYAVALMQYLKAGRQIIP
ncbi:hypothetical protein [Primorskyibacter sp. S87]|uniref:hypothetical protein n=1 Tax=Primorskyibacter sp. S87 TaxID=3415126 RepID=UPI003C7AEF72